MEKVLSKEIVLKEILNSHQVMPQKYFAHGGSEEYLFDSEGQLEAIYIYMTKEVEVQAAGMLYG